MTRARESPGDFANRCCQFRLQPLCEVTSWSRTWCHMDEWGASTDLWRHVGPSPRTVASQPTLARPWTMALHVIGCERSVQEKRIQFATLRFSVQDMTVHIYIANCVTCPDVLALKAHRQTLTICQRDCSAKNVKMCTFPAHWHGSRDLRLCRELRRALSGRAQSRNWLWCLTSKLSCRTGRHGKRRGC